jgi:hypothetical protein
LFFLDENNGWLVGTYDFDYGGIILHTSDGGVNWETQLMSEEFYLLWDVQFIDSSKGWAVGSGVILCTDDGGETWTEQDCPANSWLNSICIVDENQGWVSGWGGTILHTSNGGMGIFEPDERQNIAINVYPNPCAESVMIQYELNKTENISINLYNTNGDLVKSVYEGKKAKGIHRLQFMIEDEKTGIYILSITSKQGLGTVKLLKH